jgi:transposase-like protein
LKVDTIFENSNIPLVKWFWMIYLLANQKNGCAALALKRYLSISYKTALYMTHKIRTAMAARDAQYKLAGLVEMDDSYFGGKKFPGKRGRGSENKSTVIVGVQLSEDRRPQFTNMIKVQNMEENNIKEPLAEHIAKESIITTDGYSSYKVLKKYDYIHIPLVIGEPKQAGKLLPWVHIMIANVKSNIRGTHHGVSPKHLQRYLSEFSYRCNRRFDLTSIFDRLITACIAVEPIKIAEICT